MIEWLRIWWRRWTSTAVPCSGRSPSRRSPTRSQRTRPCWPASISPIAVVTVDAMHTQTDTAQLIVDAGGDYVFTAKGNQPKLYAACRALPWRDVPAHRVTTKGHGRRVARTIKVVTAPAWVEFHGAAQVAQLRRTVTRAGKKTVEVVYLITSADARRYLEQPGGPHPCRPAPRLSGVHRDDGRYPDRAPPL